MVLPAAPARESLVKFLESRSSAVAFYVDGKSLSVGADGVVRYTLVARSGSGAENVIYEGIRCDPAQFKVFAYGRADGAWSPRPGSWRPIARDDAQPWHYELWADYFCPLKGPILNAAEGLDALRRGGHPRLPARAGSQF